MKTLVKILVDTVPVILGILIALFINNWQQERERQAFEQRTLNTIGQEMEENRTSVARVLERHAKVMEFVQQDSLSSSLALGEILGQADGIQYPTIKHVGLRFLFQGKSEWAEYETLSTLIDIEDSHKVMDEKFDRLLDFIYANMSDTSKTTRETFASHLLNVMDSEQSLLEQYNGWLENRSDQ